MTAWFHHFDKRLWLRPDHVGAEEAAFIRSALRLRKGQRVLDAPCGAGRVAVHLANAGCQVVGLDLSRAFITRATRRAGKGSLTCQFKVCDLRDISFENYFHGVYSWQGSFGYFQDDENREVLSRYVRALRPGGRVLVDQPNRERLLRNFASRQTKGNLTIHSSWDPKAQRANSKWILRTSGDKTTSRLSMRLYTPRQLIRGFESVSLVVETMYGSIAGDSYSRASPRLILIGRKVHNESA